MEKKKQKWIVPVIVIAILVLVAYLVYRKIYDMLFGGPVAASMDDVVAQIKACTVPIVCIVVAIVGAIVTWFVVAKKETAVRSFSRITAIVAAVSVVAISLNTVALGIEYSLLNKVLTGSDGLSDETRQASRDLGEEISGESIVLLKNENSELPLASGSNINVFGWGATQPNYGGTGSGSVSEDKAVSLLQGIQNAGFTINQDLIDFYKNYRADRPVVGMGEVDWTIVQPTISDYDAAGMFENAKAFSDTAVVVLTRAGGEGMDLPDVYSSDCTYNKSQMGGDVVYSTQEDDIDSSKNYLELSNREIALFDRLNKEFDHIVVIVNSANAMELGFVDEYEHIDAALWMAGAGETGFNALGNVLSGEINPSGRLVDTYVYDHKDSPTSNNFGAFEYTNSAAITGSDMSVAKFVNYSEGIYLGYKYYETAAVEGLIDYDSVVQYPFGYGLSYTTFDESISSFTADGTTISMEVTVTNTGDKAGKNVAEIYFTPPYYNGGIEKASTNLVEFAKTDLLAPGESQTLTVTFDYEDMASYDDLTNKCYVLEHGDYEVTLNSDSHTVIDSKTVSVDKDVIYTDSKDGKRSTDLVDATNQFDYARGDVTYLSRKDGFANAKEALAAPTNYVMSADGIKNFHAKSNYNAADYDDPNAVMPTTGAKNGIKISDMTGLSFDDEKWESLLDELTVDEMVSMVADGGFKTVAVDSIGLASSTDSDGPAALSSMFNASMVGVAYPPATAIAATWNKDLALRRGTQMGIEGAEMGVTGWYGPAMNIHRSAFSGRNFEYYSEDGTMSYIMAANEVAGATSKGMLCYIKHFALNDQETFRTNGICTWSTEQAMREIYFKGFEGAVKEGHAYAVMSSFNSIGPKWAGSNAELLVNVLRNEWGFHGPVDTDALDPLADFYMDLNCGIRNGLTKGLSMSADTSVISDQTSVGTVVALRNAAHETLYGVSNSTAVMKETGLPGWVKAVIAIDVLLAAAMITLEVYAIKRYRERKAVTISKG